MDGQQIADSLGQVLGQGWTIGSNLAGKGMDAGWAWMMAGLPPEVQPVAEAMQPAFPFILVGLVVMMLGKLGGGGAPKKALKTTKPADPDKYAPRRGTPWHCWFWPLWGDNWIVPLAPGWWPRWKWLETEVKIGIWFLRWRINVSYQANWFMHTVLFHIPGIGWRLKLQVVPHMGIVGGTGMGKDAILQWIIEHERERAVVVVALDKSAPSELAMQRAGGLIIKPNGKQRWNLLAGDSRFMAERVSRFWRTPENDTGSTRGAFRRVAAAYGDGVPSEERYIGPPAKEGGCGLYAWVEAQPKFEGKDHWLNRLLDLHLALGTTDGPGGVDVTELIARKQKFGFFFDTFRMPTATNALGVAVILDLMRASADLGDLRENELGALPESIVIQFEDVVGLRGAYIILNEGGSLEKRTQELDLFLKAARARDCRVWAAVQNPDHFGGVLTSNISQWIMFATGDPATQRWQSDTLNKREPAEAFSSSGGGIKSLECFIQSNGRLQKVRLQPPDMRKPARIRKTAEPVNCSGEPARRPGVVVIVESSDSGRRNRTVHAARGLRTIEALPMLPGPELVPSYVRGRPDRERIQGKLGGTANRVGCHGWKPKSRSRAYSKASYLGRSWTAHFLMWAWRLMADDADMRRFLAAHPQIQPFEWPQAAELTDRNALVAYEIRHGVRLSLKESDWVKPNGERIEAELVRLLALQAWMRRWDLHVDHRCPGRPNPLCANAGEAGEPIQWAHLWLTTREENLELRWTRERGEYRDEMPDVLEIGA